ncbi:MAG: hypothetical protein ACE5I5_07430 [Candidatus Heimdallarchaeota archaeon]
MKVNAHFERFQPLVHEPYFCGLDPIVSERQARTYYVPLLTFDPSIRPHI